MIGSLLIIAISSFFSIILFLFCQLVVEIGITKKYEIFKEIYSENIIFYKKKYNVLFLSNISIYINLLSSSIFYLLMIGLFFLYKFEEKIELTNYWKNVYFIIFLFIPFCYFILFFVFLIRNIILFKKFKKITNNFSLEEIKNFVFKLKNNNFFEYLDSCPFIEVNFVKRFFIKINKMESSYQNKNKEYKYLIYFVYSFLLFVDSMIRYKWLTKENINNEKMNNIRESINLFNDYFSKTFKINSVK